MSDAFEIRDLAESEIAALSQLLLSQRPEYVGNFRPFAFDEATLSAQVAAAGLDRFWTLWSSHRLAGFFMMRGLDAGYQRPAFGLFVAEEFAGCGIGAAALQYAVDWARSRDLPAIVLTVAEENHAALHLYRKFEFHPTGCRAESGQPIFEKTLESA